MADQVLGEALLEIRASQEKLVGDVAKIADTLVGALQKVEKQTESAGLSGLAKSIQEVARATDAAEKQIQNLKFAAIADEVGQLTSALKGAESGVQVTEDLAKAEALLEERFGMVRAEIQRAAEAQKGLVDEEVLAARTTLQLEAAQRQHDAALATVRGRAIQAAEGIAQLEQEEQASAIAAQQSWEAVGRLAIEQQKAEQSARELAAQEAKLAADAERSAAQAKANKEAWEGAKTAYGLVSKAVVAVGTALLATEAAAVALTVKTVEQGDELNRLSDQYGVAVTTLAGMKQAFKDNELEAGDLNTALRQFSNVLGEAMAGGDKATATVEALGISTAKLKDGTLSTEDAFRIAIDSLSKMENGYGKAAISQDLFGRAGSKIPGIFKDGAKSIDAASASAMAMGNSFTEVEQQAVAKLDDAMDELSDRVAGLGASIGKELMPVAADIVREANEWIKANRELIQQDVKSFALGIRDAMKDLLPLVQHVAEALGFVGDVIAGISGPAAQSFAALRAEEARLVEETKGAEEVFRLFHPLTKELGDSADYAGMRYKSLQAQLAVVREKIAATLDPTKKAKATLADLQKVTDDEADAATRAGEANDKLPPPIIKTGDAAGKAAKKLEEQANALAEAAQKSAAFAQSQIEVAAQTGDVTRVTAAYTSAMEEAGLAYKAAIAAADAAAKAGKSDAEVQNMRTEALRQYADTVNGNAAKLNAFFKQQIDDTTELTKTTDSLAVSRAQDALSMASQKDAAAKYSAVIVALSEQLKHEREEIERKKEAGLSAADAQNELAQAEDRFKQGVEAAAQGAKKAAEGTKDLSGAAQVAGQVTDDFAKSLVDLAVSGGNAGDVLKSLGSSVLNDLTSSLTSGLGSMLKTGLADIGNEVAGGLADVLSPGVMDAAGQAGMSGAEALVGTLTDGIASMMPDAIVGALGAGGTAAAVVAGVAGIGLGIAAAFGAFEGPTIQQQVARMLSKQIKKGFRDPEVFAAIDAGLESVGLYLGEGLGTVMVKAPKRLGLAVGEAFAELGKDSSYQFSDGFYQDMQEHGTQLIHSSIADVLHVFYQDITNDVAVGIQQSALAAGAAIAKEMGLVGDKAIKFAQQWSIAFVGMMYEAGKGEDEILTALHRIDESLGTSQELIASFQRLQAAMIDAGVDMDALYAKINEQLKLITGKKVHVGNLEEVLNAVGGDASRALGVIENAMDLAGIKVEKFTGQLSDVVLAISGDAGTAIKEAGQDFRDFGSDADGTADILRQKVLTALDNVIKSAEELGYSAESIDAFKTAVGLIPPEMLKSAEFTNKLRDDFARMAAESHMSVRELVDSINPPLPAAMREAILSVEDLGKALGDLTGAPLKSLKEVTDRMKQFAGEMYQVARDENGKIKEENGKAVMELTAFGQELVDEAVTAISGMWAQMNEDGWVGLDEIGVMFDQLTLLPIEALNDPAIQQATRDLLAKIGAMTGDAAIIAMANAEVITQDMINQGLAAYEDYKKTIEENPPEVPPPTTPDGQPTTGPDGQPTGPDTTPASTTPPPAPIPPETLKSWEEITQAAKAYAAAVVEGSAAVEALSQGTVAASAKMLAAIQPIYGVPTDDVSLSAIHEKLKNITDDLLGWSGNWKDDFDKARGAVIDLTTEVGNYAGALAGIPTSITTTITAKYVTEGAPPPTPETPPPPMASGGWIPGALGAPFEITAHGRELVVPAETATTLPPDLVAQLLSGDAFTLPASMVARLSGPVVAPMVDVRGASQGGGGAASRPSSRAFEARIFSDREIGERAVVYIERQVGDGYVETGGGFKVHPMIHGKVGAR